MPSLFISYKRGTSGLNPLMERIRAEHYRIWYDKDDIHAGENWRESINRGVDTCDALLVALTPAACRSEFVQYEVKRALEQKKLIFPLKFEAIDDGEDPKLLGLTDIQFVDFTTADSDIWDIAFKKLLEDMQLNKSLQITAHTKRQQRGTAEHALHQRYLKKLVARIGTLSLANISPDASGTVRLEDVYIDSPTNLSLSIEVKDWHVVEWWFNTEHNGRTDQRYPKETVKDFIEQLKSRQEYKREDPAGFDDNSFEALIGDIDAEIATYRDDHPEQQSDGKFASRGNNYKRENYLRLHVQNIATAISRLVVLGQPGSGKSTFVKHLALCLAGEQIDGWERNVHLGDLQYWIHGELSPIYIELRRFVASKHFPAIDIQPNAENLWSYIEHEILGTELIAYLSDLKADVEEGRALIILDGLDEVPYPEGKLKARQRQLISLAEAVNSPHFAQSRVVVASRPYAYEGWTLPEFYAVTITDFEESHRIALASKLYQAAGMTADAAQEKSKSLNRQLGDIDSQLKDRPLFMTLMATVYLRGEKEGLPTRRGVLYRESVLLLLDRWTKGKVDAPSLLEILGARSVNDLYERLAALAYEVHSQHGEQYGTPEIDESLLYKHLKTLGRSVAVELIPYLSENAGVLISPGQDHEKDVFYFAHRSFQEYLVAVHIAKTCIEADGYNHLKEIITAKPQLWRLPAALVGDHQKVGAKPVSKRHL